MNFRFLAHFFRQNSLGKWIIFWAVFRSIVIFLHALRPISSPHIWRQTDTLGVALRYWLRWVIEPRGDLFLPAVLNSGDHYGYMGMEFPFLNIWAAPAFALGPSWGVNGAFCLHHFLVGALIALNYKVWKPIEIMKLPMAQCILLIPFFSISGVYLIKFIPDLVATLLVLLGIGLLWYRPRYFVATGLISLGLLVKPTALTALAILLLREDRWPSIRRYFLPVSAAVAVAGTYYTIGMQVLKSFEKGPALFAVAPKQPITGLLQFFGEALNLGDFLFNATMYPGGIAIAIGYLAWEFLAKKSGGDRSGIVICSVILVQFFIIAALSGNHVYQHTYYLMGSAPLFVLLLMSIWRKQLWIRVFFSLLITFRLAEISGIDLQGFFSKNSTWARHHECQRLRRETPLWPWDEGKVFRSTEENYPALGLCFGERQGSVTSALGFFHKSEEPLPKNCAPVATGEWIVLAECAPKSLD